MTQPGAPSRLSAYRCAKKGGLGFPDGKMGPQPAALTWRRKTLTGIRTQFIQGRRRTPGPSDLDVSGCHSPTPEAGPLGSAEEVAEVGKWPQPKASKVPLSKGSETRVDPEDPVTCIEPEY